MQLDDPIRSPETLLDAPDLVWLDARSGVEGARDYARAHLLGAFHVELERDLSAPPADARQGGRHPLPDVQAFCARLGRFGITPQSRVVVYDAQGGANAAARIWWMLRALGHTRVHVLDGGWQAALDAGLPVSSEAPMPATASAYPGHTFGAMPVRNAAQVELARQDPASVVVDVRSAARYRGESEPIDPVAGHIPGAINVPLSDNLDARGRFKSAEALRQLYTPRLPTGGAQTCTVHCGSGVTACHTLLALDRAGLSGAALYVGSWSEWCRHASWPRTP